MLTLSPGQVSLASLNEIWRNQGSVRIDDVSRQTVEFSARKVAEVAAGDEAVYGINTGFGKLASIRIASDDTATLQRNLILSHCAGVGPLAESAQIRLMMVLKLISLGRGASGVRLEIIDQLEAMLEKGVVPCVRSQGSVGASGDLAPLAQMAACMIGEDQAWFEESILPAHMALEQAGLIPVMLGPKEGLALINGTQFSTAYALSGLFAAWTAAMNALVISSLSIDAAMASTAPLAPEIHELRGHPGQIKAASIMRQALEGSDIRDSHREDDPRVQDPYCMRCQPQVTGAAMDLLVQAGQILQREANAATDNPLYLAQEDRFVSGGNFHAEPVAFAADMIALAIAEIGSIAQRRIALLVDPTLSFDLPPFLAREPGLNSGMMIAEVTSAALMSENKHLANPCSTDSTPTSANQEDHVSMAAHGARRLGTMIANLQSILGIELLCATEGVEYRSPLKTSPPLQRVISAVREVIPPLEVDRILSGNLGTAKIMVADGSILNAAGLTLPELED